MTSRKRRESANGRPNSRQPPRRAVSSWPIDEPHSIPIQLRLECEAMARYVLQHALAISPEVITDLMAVLRALDQAAVSQTPHRRSHDLETRLQELAAIHQRLAQAVAPATPQGITVLDIGRRQTRYAWLGPVPLIRRLTITAVVFLISLIISAIPAEVSTQNMARGVLGFSGLNLLLNMLFLLNCAGLGASFAMLFHAHRYIADGTYDPRYDASYAARLILGLIAGLILAELLPAALFEGGALSAFGKPALSMLAGYSATAVQRLLQRLVEALESLARGDRTSQIQATLAARHANAMTNRIQSQNEIAAQLIALQQSIDTGTSLAAFRERLMDVTKTVLSADQSDASRNDNQRQRKP